MADEKTEPKPVTTETEKKPDAGSMAEAQAALGSTISRLVNIREGLTASGDAAGNFRSRLDVAIATLRYAENGE